MKVGIVGAGMAGLSAARKLASAGVSVKVFEKSHVLGGRVATRKVGDYFFDTGATRFRHVILTFRQ
jgi:predicted NAD/FAD-dependent oxidoreductase